MTKWLEMNCTKYSKIIANVFYWICNLSNRKVESLIQVQIMANLLSFAKLYFGKIWIPLFFPTRSYELNNKVSWFLWLWVAFNLKRGNFWFVNHGEDNSTNFPRKHDNSQIIKRQEYIWRNMIAYALIILIAYVLRIMTAYVLKVMIA